MKLTLFFFLRIYLYFEVIYSLYYLWNYYYHIEMLFPYDLFSVTRVSSNGWLKFLKTASLSSHFHEPFLILTKYTNSIQKNIIQINKFTIITLHADRSENLTVRPSIHFSKISNFSIFSELDELTQKT